MKTGWYVFVSIMILICVLVLIMIGYSLPRSNSVVITEDSETIKIYIDGELIPYNKGLNYE